MSIGKSLFAAMPSLATNKHLPVPISIPYIAGFFDGEGSLGIYRNGHNTPHLLMQVCQNLTETSVRIFLQLEGRFGGSLHEQRTPHGSKIAWQLCARNAATFLARMHPYLIIKHEQVTLALWWQRQRPLAGPRDARGRTLSYPPNVTRLDAATEQILRLLKRYPLNQIPPKLLTEPNHDEVLQTLMWELNQPPRGMLA